MYIQDSRTVSGPKAIDLNKFKQRSRVGTSVVIMVVQYPLLAFPIISLSDSMGEQLGLWLLNDGRLQIRRGGKIRVASSTYKVQLGRESQIELTASEYQGKWFLRGWVDGYAVVEAEDQSASEPTQAVFGEWKGWVRETAVVHDSPLPLVQESGANLRVITQQPFSRYENFEEGIPSSFTPYGGAIITQVPIVPPIPAVGVGGNPNGLLNCVRVDFNCQPGDFSKGMTYTVTLSPGDYLWQCCYTWIPSIEFIQAEIVETVSGDYLAFVSLDTCSTTEWCTVPFAPFTIVNPDTEVAITFSALGCPGASPDHFFIDYWTVYEPIIQPQTEGTCVPKLTGDLVITQRHKRNFIQFGSARPNNPVHYAGQDAQYMKIEGVSAPESGGVDPIWVPDPRRPGRYKLVNRSITPADLASASIVMLENHGSIPRQLGTIGCPFNAYEVTGNCKDLSDFMSGWSDYVLIYSGGIVTDKDLGDRSAWDSDDAIEDTLSVTLGDIYPIGALAFGEKAAPNIDREVIDVVYGSSLQCGECGIQDDGTNRIYAVTKSSGAGSPGLPAEVVYTVDGGLTWTETNITGIGASEDPVAIEIVGDKLVVVSQTAGSATLGGYYYATINQATGIPGTWTKVTTGFVANFPPTDIFALNPREVFFSANGGYIYESTDITAGVVSINQGVATSANLYRIHGNENTVVAVGASSTVIVSHNRGASFAVAADSPADIALDIRALLVMDDNRYWVGTNNSGRLYYTLNGGESWTERAFSGSGAGNLRDIVAATDEVLYFSHDNNTPTARIFTAWDGGVNFTNAAPRILNMPTYNRANRLALPYNTDPTTASNNVAIAGLSGGGTDGILLLGIATRF